VRPGWAGRCSQGPVFEARHAVWRQQQRGGAVHGPGDRVLGEARRVDAHHRRPAGAGDRDDERAAQQHDQGWAPQYIHRRRHSCVCHAVPQGVQ
ncbi:hypothetical protein G6514_006693, partial [Epicoccum nigrum]